MDSYPVSANPIVLRLKERSKIPWIYQTWLPAGRSVSVH